MKLISLNNLTKILKEYVNNDEKLMKTKLSVKMARGYRIYSQK